MNKFIDNVGLVHNYLTPGNDPTPTPTLVIGDMHRWRKLGFDLPEIDGFVFVDFDDVTLYTLETVGPQVILSPLMGRTFDAVEIARRLSAMGYLGRYRVISDGIPDPKVIEKDVRDVAPRLDFAVVSLPSIKPPS